MPYQLKPEPGETVLLDVRFQPSQKSEPFHFAVSDQALYLPARKLVVSGDPTFFQRVLKSDIKEVSVQEVRPYGSWVFAVLMVLTGVALGISCLASNTAVPARAYGWALALIVGGCIMPFAAKGRQRLVVTHTERTFKWNPPFVVDNSSKRQVKDILSSILDACRETGIPTVYPAQPKPSPVI